MELKTCKRRQRVRKNVLVTWNELRNKLNMMVLAKTENGLGNGIQSGGESHPLFPKVEQSCRIVRKERHRTTPKDRQKTLNTVKDRYEFPVVD